MILHVGKLLNKAGEPVETCASQSNEVASEVAANVKRKRDPMEKMSYILELHKKLKGCLERTTEKIALKEKQNAVRKQEILELQEKVLELETANEKEENEIAELKEMEQKRIAKLESYKMKIRKCADEIMIAL
ncbi:unnamed protein product [Microthlaspi erraticum]|uniref:Uncharacterized protein n=1 Tax=Microthlaspi erraticum TaxID=1685480 RepID=A0A6D2JRP3_9BRAS|nr:unnamed protein product [Microthlaspi erraticum]